jgi:hypothetical protein
MGWKVAEQKSKPSEHSEQIQKSCDKAPVAFAVLQTRRPRTASFQTPTYAKRTLWGKKTAQYQTMKSVSESEFEFD